jgi:hypothetical protein
MGNAGRDGNSPENSLSSRGLCHAGALNRIRIFENEILCGASVPIGTSHAAVTILDFTVLSLSWAMVQPGLEGF